MVFMLVFLVIAAMIVVTMIRGIGEWHKNNESPRLTVDAEVVAKRTRTDTHCHDMAGDPTGATRNHAHHQYKLFCYISGGKRRQDGIFSNRFGVWNAGRERQGKTFFSGDALSGI